MRKRDVATQAAVLVALIGATTPVSTAAGADGSPAVLRVANGVACSDTGTGSDDLPFCTISAAAAVVRPGQTVLVEPGAYSENVRITRSGTAAAPITFVADNGPRARVSIETYSGAVQGVPFSLTGVHDVTLRGFSTDPNGKAEGFLVSGSSDVVIEDGYVQSLGPAVRVTGASHRVQVRRMALTAYTGGAVQVDPGSTDTVVSTNSTLSLRPGALGVLATDAPGTVVTSNTVVGMCSGGVSLAGTSTGATVENNIIETNWAGKEAPSACTGGVTVPLSVSPGSATGTTAAYNLIQTAAGGSLYDWAGTRYPTPAAFAAATGQGGHDIAADPQLQLDDSGDARWFTVAHTSPAVDSANADAPGELPQDDWNQPRTDDPSTTNSGGGALSYFDRGAAETHSDRWLSGPYFTVGPTPGGAALDQTLQIRPTPQDWTANGPAGIEYAVQFDDEPFPVHTDSTTVTHSYHRAGMRDATVTSGLPGFVTGAIGSYGGPMVVGADYTPVTPTRLLDTRNATGVPTTVPIAPGGDLFLPVPTVNGVAAKDLSALVANVTVTQPTADGYLTVSPYSGTPNASNLNFKAGQTVPNMVTVPVAGDTVHLHNGSSGTVHVVVDLAGYFGPKGYGFRAQSPARVLDTRTAGGPLRGNGDLTLDLSGRLPADAAAVVLNMTVTQPAAPGFLTVHPAGEPLPTASNLNFKAGQTVPNLVVAKVTNGKVVIHNGSWGTTHVIADLQGYYGTTASGATGAYVPFGPRRIVDTRNGTGVYNRPVAAIPPHDTLYVSAGRYDQGMVDPLPTAQLLNVTVTQPTADGFLTIYPDDQARPTASSLNFTAGQTVPNLVPVAGGAGIAIYNGSNGTVQIVVDQEGYFFPLEKAVG